MTTLDEFLREEGIYSDTLKLTIQKLCNELKESEESRKNAWKYHQQVVEQGWNREKEIQRVTELNDQLAKDLAIARETNKHLQRRLQKLEGEYHSVDKIVAAARHERNLKRTRGMGNERVIRAHKRIRAMQELLRFFGASDEYDSPNGVRKHNYECFMIWDLATQRDEWKSQAKKLEEDYEHALDRIPELQQPKDIVVKDGEWFLCLGKKIWTANIEDAKVFESIEAARDCCRSEDLFPHSFHRFSYVMLDNHKKDG